MKVSVGDALPYQKLDRKGAKSIRAIRGIYKAWLKAQKYILRLDSNGLRYYLSKDEQLTKDRKEAKIFKHGFDNPLAKVKYWNTKLGLKFHEENY
jgi:hypothetical protein